MAGGIHECLLHSHECVGVETMGLKEDIITQHRINGVSYYDLRRSLHFINKGLPAYTEETFAPIISKLTMDVIATIPKTEVSDPFFWNQKLNQDWATDLIEMILTKNNR